MDYAEKFVRDGFVILPEHLPAGDVNSAAADLIGMYPSAADFHSDPRSEINRRYLSDEFAGIRTFPFPSVLLCLLAVHPQLIRLAEELLGTTAIRLYTAELWVKYTGAAVYDQPLLHDPRWIPQGVFRVGF